jgi:S-formylglutathione hydrolase FrmB
VFAHFPHLAGAAGRFWAKGRRVWPQGGAALPRRFVAAAILILLAAFTALALPVRRPPRPWELNRFNAELKGHVYDFTRNHGRDNRFWSKALCEKRDMYVYVPPCYDPAKQYPLLIWLHGFSQDEKNTKSVTKQMDKEIVAGRIPPMVVAAPDGTFKGHPTMTNSGSFFINGVKGRYEDFLADDVYDFLISNFSIRPEREAHVIAGASMGGTSAYSIAFKHKEKFGVIVGIMPLLDLMYVDCHGDHFGKFDPNCLGRLDHYDPRQSAGRIWGFNIRYGTAMKPLFGDPPNVEARLPGENPVEQLMIYDVKPGEFAMLITYGSHDNFNGDSENESFRYYANLRGIEPEVVVDPNGKHNKKTGMGFFGAFGRFLTPLIQPYVPQ